MNERDATVGTRAASLWWRNGLIWAALLILLFSSLWIAYVPIGAAKTAAGIVIAVVKAGLVAILFMELGRAKGLIRLAALAGFLFLAVFFALTFSDVLVRLSNG